MRSDAIFAVAMIGVEGGEKCRTRASRRAEWWSAWKEEGGVVADGKVAPVAVAERPRHRVRRRGRERPRLLL